MRAAPCGGSSHASMHGAWKVCPHARRRAALALGIGFRFGFGFGFGFGLGLGLARARLRLVEAGAAHAAVGADLALGHAWGRLGG